MIEESLNVPDLSDEHAASTANALLKTAIPVRVLILIIR
jgi:hypothetical protein